MTALEQYLRLEAVGIWRETARADPREVVVSFGATTLVLTDLGDRPLGHWALAGVQKVGRTAEGTVYAMTPEGGETLTIADREMVAAIAAVTRRGAPRPKPPRRRRGQVLVTLGILAVFGFTVTVAPGLIAAQAARMMPPERAEEAADRILLGLMERRALCDQAEFRRALGLVAASIDPADPPRLRVMDLGQRRAVVLPGRTVLVDRTALAAAAGPDEVAGWVATALAGEPVADLMHAVGPVAGLTYILTGELGDPAVARARDALVAGPDGAGGPPAPCPPAG